jgi:hypothetical protein
MNFTISVISVSVSTKVAASSQKPYQNVEVVFKNEETGKVGNKNITQYSSEIFNVMSGAAPGQRFSVSSEKNDRGYWEWTKSERLAEGAPPAAASVPAPAESGAVTGTRTPPYRGETPQERAEKQVYIVKQSSISSAIALLSVGAKAPPTPEEVIKTAQKFVDFVFDVNKQDLFDEENDLDVS